MRDIELYEKILGLEARWSVVKRNLDNVLTYCIHRMNNAVAEGINSKIMAIKRCAGGYRNPEHFKIAVYFYCGGLELYTR